jgi:hypothetical protein
MASLVILDMILINNSKKLWKTFPCTGK